MGRDGATPDRPAPKEFNMVDKKIDINKLDYIPPELEEESKNKSGFKKHPKYDYIPDGKEGKKLLADDKEAVKAKEKKKVAHVGDTAVEEDNICKECGYPFLTKEALEEHIEKVHKPQPDLKKLSIKELVKIANKKGKGVLITDTKQEIIDKIGDNA